MRFEMLFNISQPMIKYSGLAVRAIQIIISAAIAGIFIKLLITPYWATPKLEIGVLLAFTITTILQSVAAAILTFFSYEKGWLAALDMVCICAFVTTAVMARSLTTNYACHEWLSQSEGQHDDAMLHARDPGERAECGALKGVFGIAIVQCVMLLATFQLILFAMRARRDEELRMEAMTEKRQRADSGRGGAGVRPRYA